MMKYFSDEEYSNRVKRIKARMEKDGIEVLLISSPANQNYATGYDGQSFYTPQVVIISNDLDQPIWFGRAMDAVGAKFTVFMDHQNITPYPDNYVGSKENHPMDILVNLIKDRGWDKRRIGTEMDDYYYTAYWHQILRSGLPDAKFINAFLLVNWVRMKKSDNEIEFMMKAGSISSKAMQALIDKARPGVRQCDAMAALYNVTIGGTEAVGGTFPCKPPNAMVGEYCSAPHLTWTDQPLKENDMFYIEQAGVHHRYHSPLSRCFFLGKPTKEMLYTSNVIAEGLNAVLDTVKPGLLCEDLEVVWKKVISKYGIEKDSRIGYPVGIGYPPTWGELTCSLRNGDKTILEENMTFHCIPALWLENYGLVISESFVVTKDGAKTFCEFPRKLFHL